MIASHQTLQRLRFIEPFHTRQKLHGLTFGCGPAGYDVRVAEPHVLRPETFELGSTIEKFTMPNDMLGYVKDKSTWVRQGLCVQNTVIEPGWVGHLTLEFTHHGSETLILEYGMPIAQIIFHFLDAPTDWPYGGKYQNQPLGPQSAKFE